MTADIHLPSCRFESYNDIAAKFGEMPPEDQEWGAQAGIRICAAGCPVMQRAVDYGRKLALEHGW